MTTLNNPEASQCHCADPDVDRLLDLMALGYTQVQASLALWAERPDPQPWPLRQFDPFAPTPADLARMKRCEGAA